MYKIKDAEIQQQIQSGLVAFKKLAKARLKPRWKTLSWVEKREAARALVFMDKVAHNPAKYFSREQTEAQWYTRAMEYAEQNNLNDYRAAYYIVQDPRGIVWYGSINAMRAPLSNHYYHFLSDIQNYEYATTDWERKEHAKQIQKVSKRVCSDVDIMESKPIIKQWKLFTRNLGLSG